MATVFWDSEGIVLTDYLEHGTTITGTYYADLIRKCPAAEKRRGKLRRGVIGGGRTGREREGGKSRPTVISRSRRLWHKV